jgi:hypothetical protein
MNIDYIKNLFKKNFTIIKWIIIVFIISFVLYKGYSLTYKGAIKSGETGKQALLVWHGVWVILLLILLAIPFLEKVVLKNIINFCKKLIN